MPTREQMENLITIAVKLGQANTDNNPVMLSRNLCKLHKIAVSLRNRYEAVCSYDWANTDDYLKKTEKLEIKAESLAQEIGLKACHHRDPRGVSLTLTGTNAEFVLF